MLDSYYKLFGLGQVELNTIISEALKKGAYYADLFFEYCSTESLSLRDGIVDSINSDLDYGGGVRALNGDKTAYAYSEITSFEKMLKAARYAAEIANKQSAVVNIPCTAKELAFTKYYPQNKTHELGILERKELLLELDAQIREADSRITKVNARIQNSTAEVLFYNSEGEIFCDYRPMTSIVISCVMEFNGRRENFSCSRSHRQGFDMLNPTLLSELKSQLIDGCSRLFEAQSPKGGEMPVVMGRGSSGILLHEAIGHSFEADFIRKGTSIFTDMMGKQICRKGINIVDDGTIINNRGSVNVDDEGIIGQKTYMVKDGVLNSFLHDRISAKHYGVAPTGNGRRESFRYPPIPRMRATYMENGNAKTEDLIRSVKKGIYVDNFSNGQVQIGAGDFTFFVKSGYLIEDGKITRAIKDTNIIGNGPKALADIQELASDYLLDDSTWTCGKEQSVPVSCGMPSVLIKSLNVGGVF